MPQSTLLHVSLHMCECSLEHKTHSEIAQPMCAFSNLPDIAELFCDEILRAVLKNKLFYMF